MDLEPFLAQLRRDLTAAARTGADEVQVAAGHLVAALDPAARLVLLDVLVTAADELTSIAGAAVEVRLRGRDVDFVVHTPAAPEVPVPPAPPEPPAETDDATARVSLRLPETLKVAAEAKAAAEGVSLNTWLVRSVSAAVGGSTRRTHGPGTRLTGWARS